MKIKQFIAALATLCTTSVVSYAQPLSAYTNFQNQFMVWDNGITRKLEFLLPINYDIGRVAIPYIDNSRNFKVYYQGASQQINTGFTSGFKASDYLITYLNGRALFVWDEGKTKLLSANISSYAMGDSLVVFYDEVQKMFKAYYDKETVELESFLGAGRPSIMFDTAVVNSEVSTSGSQLQTIKVSDNIAGYVNYNNQFKLFYKGEIINEDDYSVSSFDVGRNTAAYVNYNDQFNIFHKGKTVNAEGFKPINYKVGDNLVAYISSDYYFKIFYEGQIYEVGYMRPEYSVADNVVTFVDNSGYYRAFYKGQIYTLDVQAPKSVKKGYNSVAFINNSGFLKLFTAGKIYDVTSGDLTEWRLDYDVLQYRFGQNLYKVYHEGRDY